MVNKIFNKDVFWNTIGLTFNSFNSLFFLIIINRINGVNEAGIFSFAFSIACLLFIVGIYQGRIFQVSDSNGVLNNKEYFIHKCITCFLMIVLGFIYVLIRNYTFHKNLIIIILCLYKCIEAFEENLYAYLQKNEALYIVGRSMFFKSIFGVILFLLVDLYTNNLTLSCMVLVINSLLFMLFYDLKHSYKYIGNESVRLHKVLNLFTLGFSVFGFSFLAVYIVNIPKYVIDFLLSDAAQTVFGIIVMPGTVVSLCGQYITAPVLNQMVDFYANEQYKNLKQLINKIVLLLCILGLIIEIGAFVLGIPVLSFIYAIDLSLYKKDLILVLLGALCYAVAGIYSTALITMRKNNIQLLIYMIDGVFGFIICYVMISKFGIHGATYGYLATMLLHIILYFLYYKFQIKNLEVTQNGKS